MSQKLVIKNRSGKDISFSLVVPDGTKPEYISLAETKGSHKATRLEIDLATAKKSVFHIHGEVVDVIFDNKEVRKSFLGKNKERDIKRKVHELTSFTIKDNTDHIIFQKVRDLPLSK